MRYRYHALVVLLASLIGMGGVKGQQAPVTLNVGLDVDALSLIHI